MKNHCSAKSRQRGAVFAIFVIAMVAIIAMAGLALDVSHAYINKTQLQNALDAAAMSGAMTLSNLADDAGAEAFAELDAVATFKADLESDLKNLEPVIEFSHTLDPFVTPAVGTPLFVRARVDDYDMSTWLLGVIGRDSIGVRASAVSGPINITPCDIGPFIVCADMTEGQDCSDPNNCYGYKVAQPGDTPQECFLKAAAGGQPNNEPAGDQCGSETGAVVGDQIGAGNFHLREFPSCSTGNGGGAKCMKESLGIGARNACLEGDTITTQTGNMVSIRKAFNTIFGDVPNGNQYSADEFPPDSDTRTGIFYDYDGDNGDVNSRYHGNDRRVMPVVIAECTDENGDEIGGNNGKSDLKVLTVGCFFLTRPLPGPGEGGTGNNQIVWGQFIGECPSNGEKTLTPNPVFDIEKIILYKDPDSRDS